MAYRYITTFPENVKDSYTEYSSIDFVMTFEGMALVPNSVRIKADLDVFTDAQQQTRANQDIVDRTNAAFNRTPVSTIRIDSMVGAHCFVDSITTDFQSAGTVENFQQYGRYCRMVADTTMTQDDQNNSEALCELRAPNDECASQFLAGCLSNLGGDTAAGVVDSNDFSIKPRFCLNNMSSPLNYSKSGAVRVNIKLSRNANALYLDQTNAAGALESGANYVLRNVRLCYQTMNPVKEGKVTMRTKLGIKQSVLSAFSNVSTKVPAVCNSVSCSFVQQNHENDINYNQYKTEPLPNLTRLQFLFNDSQNAFVTYEIKSRVETLQKYIESFANAGVNNVSLRNLMHNESYGIGLAFGEFIDLSSQKFNVQLESNVDSNFPYTLYMYFHSISSI